MEYLKTTFIAGLSCVVLILTLRKFAHYLGMLDHPDERKLHGRVVPTVGGLAMFAAVILALLFSSPLPHGQIILLFCAAALLVMGWIDDIYGLSASLRLMIQVVLVLIVITESDSTISQLGTIWGKPITLGLLALPLSLIAFVGGINAMNMIDGADGVAGSMAAITLVGVLTLIGIGSVNMSVALPVALLAALVGFLIFNSRIFVRKAWVFMGDAGSMWLGLVVVWLLEQVSRQHTEPSIMLWLFGMPLIDTLAVILRRISRKKSPFKADRTHIHHVLQRFGFSTGRKTALLALAQSLLVAIGVILDVLDAPTVVILGSFITLFSCYYYLLRRH